MSVRMRNCPGRSTRAAFTLVELLVVVAIIGILIAMLLPAVQAARESARRATCKNNVKQLAMACLSHLERNQFLPTGGWSWRWAGEPDRGFTKKQPGGWMYNILPFIEQENLHKKGGDPATGAERAGTAVEAFYCPSRRRAVGYPYIKSDGYCNIDAPSPTIGRSDYAACAGSAPVIDSKMRQTGPETLADGDKMSDDQWEEELGGTYQGSNGVVFRRSEVKVAHIKDGTSSTYLVGEKYLTNSYYTTGQGKGSDQGWDVGFDYDTIRWTHNSAVYWPKQDRTAANPGNPNDPMVQKSMYAFGSAHSVGFHMALCDGSVRQIRFSIDPIVHARLGNRKDGEAIDSADF